MALINTTWYCNSVKHAAVTVRPQNAAVAAGVIRRQFTTPTVGNERCFVCIVAGTTANVADATWVLTIGAKTVDGTATWMECTGQAALNGDLTNTMTWAQVKAVSPAVLGQIIKRSNNASYQICTTAGAMSASEPAFSDTVGVTTTDTTAVWTSLGPVGSFSGGAAPHARLTNALAGSWVGAGGCTVYVGSNHAETQAAAMSIGLPTSATLFNKVLCHNHAGSYPPAASDLTTGATVTTTGAFGITISGNGATYIYGIAFQAGTGAVNASINLGAFASGVFFDNCSMQLVVTGANSKILLGGGGSPSYTTLNNTPVKFGNAGQSFDYGGVGQFVWQNTAPGIMAGSSIPNSLFNWNSFTSAFKATIEAVDLSAVTGNLVGYANPLLNDTLFKDCKINASATVAAATRTANNTQLIRCDSGATAYKSSRHTCEGVETTDIAVTRAGGAQDPTGQVQSRKIVTAAATLLSWAFPYKAEPYAIWNSVTGADVTVTLYGIVNAAAVPQTDELWMDLEYLGSSSSPQGFYATTNKSSVLAAAAAVASDSSDWDNTATARVNSAVYALGDVIKVASNPNRVFFCTTAGTAAGSEPAGYASAVDGGSVSDGASAVFRAGCRFKLVATLSSPQPGLASYIHVRPRAAKALTTYYIDPQVNLS